MFKPPGLYILLVGIGIATPIITSFLWSSEFGFVLGGIKFKSDITFNSVAQILTVLFLIATFLERALEVYMITFRKPGENEYGIDGKNSKSNYPKTLDEYKNETSKIALLSALTIGIVISMTGIRGIEQLIDLTTDLEPTDWQISWFRVSDILLTGGVIAGGSDFIHKILQIFTTFMDTITMAQKSTEARSKVEVANANAEVANANAAAVASNAAAAAVSNLLPP